MAEIRVQEKPRRPAWMWMVAAVVLLLIALAVFATMRGEDRTLQEWEARPAADAPAGEAVPPGTFGDPADPGADPAVPGATGVDPGAPGTELGPDDGTSWPGATEPPR